MASRKNNFNPDVVMAVRRAGASWRWMVAASEGSARVRIVASGAEPATSADAGESALLEIRRRNGAGAVVRVLTGGETICRTTEIAAGSEREMLSAAELAAEAALPESVPMHRRALGLLPAGGVPGGERGMRTVLATAWIGAIEGGEIGDGGAGAASGSKFDADGCVAEVGALAALASAGRSADEAWTACHADESSGSIAVLACGSTRIVARQLIGEAGSSSSLGVSVTRAARETSASAGGGSASGVEQVVGRAGVQLPTACRGALASLVKGASVDERWLDENGLLLGAALLWNAGRRAGAASAEGEDSSGDRLRMLAGLARMTSEPPKARESALGGAVSRASGWFEAPGRARALIVAAALILILGPIAAALGRQAILRGKSVRFEEQKTTREETQRKAALYAQLEISRWPMTKLLSDVSVATPVGVSLDMLNLSPETGLKIAGRADSQALVNQLQSSLNATKLLRDVKVNRTGSLEDGGVEFDITASVSSPHTKVVAAEDFASKNLAVRLHGEGASNTAEAPKKEKNGKSRRLTRDTSSEGDDEKSGSSGKSRRPAEEGPPAALSDADIGKMDRSGAMSEWAKRRSYVQKNPNLEASVKDRLNAEVTKLREQMNKATSSGGKEGGKQ